MQNEIEMSRKDFQKENRENGSRKYHVEVQGHEGKRRKREDRRLLKEKEIVNLTELQLVKGRQIV